VDLLDILTPDVDLLAWPPPADSGCWLRNLRQNDYDLVLDWLGSPRTAWWTALTNAGLRVGYDLPRRRWAYNVQVPRNRLRDIRLRGFAGEAFLDPLRTLGLAPEPWRTPWSDPGAQLVDGARLGPPYRSAVERWLQRAGTPVLLVMSATWRAKAWPAGQVAALCRESRAAGWNPLLALGPGDEWLQEELQTLLAPDFFAPPTSLWELADLLQKAELFVGTDCGPRHLAALLGKPTVTLFGPTDPNGWNPGDRRHVSVRTGVACSPCDLAVCPVPGHPCLSDLTSRMVLDAMDRVLGLA
jgi:ADP-heptose:LPS heptosyltransferase